MNYFMGFAIFACLVAIYAIWRTGKAADTRKAEEERRKILEAVTRKDKAR